MDTKDAAAFCVDQLRQREIKIQTLLPVGYINTSKATMHHVPGCPLLSAGHYSREAQHFLTAQLYLSPVYHLPELNQEPLDARTKISPSSAKGLTQKQQKSSNQAVV